MKNKINLNGDWFLSLENINDESENNAVKKIQELKRITAKVPGTVHTDLLSNQIIEDPFYSTNENKLNWIANCDWVYLKEFSLDKSENEEYQLIFDGLDTIAEIYLNDNIIGRTKNMFLQYKLDVSKFLINGQNKLKVIFKSPHKYSEEEENKYSKLPVALNSSRVYIRKAQYSYGWDWGPVFTTSGIWKDVYLITKAKVAIENITFNTISINEDEAEVEIKLKINSKIEDELILAVKLSNDSKVVEKELTIKDKESTIRLIVQNPKLWYPNGEGEPNLYKLSLKLFNNENEIYDEKNKIVGIRTIELLDKRNNEPDFLFKINGETIYCKGANWIPGDSFLPRVSDEKYWDLLTKAKDANMNIIRVWGGGIYENDIFYEYCDKLGLLVWQDFMFACGAYPEHKSIIENIKGEVSQNISRLQHHPSIAIWCGNNENEWGWHQDQKTPVNELPGYKIYNSIIPNILKTIDPKANYWQSSPFGNDEDPNSTNSGNTHHWAIWSFWKDYTEVKSDQSLFVTEFGFQGPANIDTFNKCIPEKNRKSQDPIFEFHNKQIEGPERLFKFLSAHLPVVTNWDDFIYLTQLNQGFALKTCLEHWRTNNRTNGSIIWQLNDVWPVTSWSLIDSESSPKLSYYFVKEIFSPQLIHFVKEGNNVSLKIQNQSKKKFEGEFKLYLIDAPTGKKLDQVTEKVSIEKNSNHSIDLATNFEENKNIIAIVFLYNKFGNQISSNYHNELPWKYIKFAKPQFSLEIINKNNITQVAISSNSPAFFVDLYAEGIQFDCRAFHIIPDEEVTINITGEKANSIKVNDIKIFSLNNYL